MRLAFLDCPMGVSGDMLLGALLDAGLDGDRLTAALEGLHLSGYTIRWERVTKGPLAATQVTISVQDAHTERRLADVLALLDQADLPPDVRDDAKAVFRRLAHVEAEVHGTTPDQVHFHELGAVDTLVDIVGVLWGMRALGVERLVASPLPVAPGWTDSMHGPLPLPAPATLALLRGLPIVPAPVQGELVTPTGVALVSHLADAFGPPPPMTLQGIGYGAGRKAFERPNVLRLWLGEAEGRPSLEPVTMLETNIDDMNPQLYAHVAERLFAAGALDVTLTPVQMKKGRPGVVLSVLCRPEEADALSAILFSETTTLGVRRLALTRQALPRRTTQVHTPYGPVRFKVATLPNGRERAMPEYEDCRRLAQQAGVPLALVIEAAVQAYQGATARPPAGSEMRRT